MAKKKIECLKLNHFGKEVGFHKGIKVKFDSKGIGEVDEKEYDELLSAYEGFVCEVGGRKAKNTEIVEKEEEGNEKAKQLRLELEKQKGITKTREESIATLTEEVKTWKGKVDELLADADKVAKGDVAQLNEEIKSLQEQVAARDFEIELWKQNVNSLRAMIKDFPDVPAEKYEKEKDKEVLVNILIEESKKI